MSNQENQYVWTEKYRPSKVQDLVLPDSVKKKFKGILKKGEMTNMLFFGGSGVGKTSSAKALCSELGFEYMFIRGKDCGIDTARFLLPEFASGMSFGSNNRRVILVDECEKMTEDFAKALQSFVEEFADNVAFILTTNFPNRLSPAIRSRFNDVCFDISGRDEKNKMFGDIVENISSILDKEKIVYDRKVISKFVLNHFPDMRKTLSELQIYSLEEGVIDTGILSIKNDEYEGLMGNLKSKNFREMLETVKENDIEFIKVSEYLLTRLDAIDSRSVAVIIKLINEYDYKNSFVQHKQVLSEVFGSAVSDQ